MTHYCKICSGQIQTGEPVIIYEDGIAHRFSTTCKWFKEQIAKHDKDFLEEMKISLGR